MPRELVSHMQGFTQYYQAKHNHRLLKWCYSLGSATVSARFPRANRSFDCVVGTFQMCILMSFNNAAHRDYSLTFKDLKEALKMDDDTLTKNLKSMMMVKFKLLELRSAEAAGK